MSQDLATVKGTAVSLGQLTGFLSVCCLEQTRVHFLTHVAFWQIMGCVHIAKLFLIGNIRIVQSASWEQLVVHIFLWIMPAMIRHGLREYWLAKASFAAIVLEVTVHGLTVSKPWLHGRGSR